MTQLPADIVESASLTGATFYIRLLLIAAYLTVVMAQAEVLCPSTIRPNSMPSLPDFIATSVEFEYDPNSSDPKSGLVEWVEDGLTCSLDATHRFRPYRRRHHCRACGLVVCSSCSRSARPLQGFGLPGDRPHRLCDACACRSNDDLNMLASLWQAAANKNVSTADLADAMSAVYNAGFRFASDNAVNWKRIRQRLVELLQLEIGVVQNLLKELIGASRLTVNQIDELGLRRANRLMKTLDECTRQAPILVSEAFRAAFNRVVTLREHCEQREAVALHHNRMMRLLETPFSDLATRDVVDVWGAYQMWAEDNRQVVSKALEGRVRELLNRVVRREQSAANAELEMALNSRNFVEIRKAMTTCDSVMGVLANNPYRDHVMPDIHVVIPGFAAHRRSATKLIAAASRNKLLRRELQKSLYPPKRI